MLTRFIVTDRSKDMKNVPTLKSAALEKLFWLVLLLLLAVMQIFKP